MHRGGTDAGHHSGSEISPGVGDLMKGRVTERSIQALYVVVKRANALVCAALLCT